jgi:D-3-phosphoglycerate dehydrogenase
MAAVSILIADSLSPKVVQALESSGYIVRMDPALTSQTLVDAIGTYQILIVRSTRVPRPVFAASKGLALVIRAGAGVDTIDVDAASEYGVRVANTPGCNAAAVAEVTFAHILACDRQIVNATTSLRAGEWRKQLFLNCPGLKGRTLGVLGAGSVGQAVARIAKGVGMRVIMASLGFEPCHAADLGVEWAPDHLELAKVSDVITIHIFYVPESHHLLSKQFFDLLKPGATFINTSRGALVDTPALIEAIKTRQLRVGLDVYENEPGGGTGDFAQAELANLACSATPHTGGSTEQANEEVANETLNVVRTFATTGEVLHCVNIDATPAADLVLTIRHKGVLPAIVAVIAGKNGEILTVNNQCLGGGKSQTAAIRVRGKEPVDEAILALPGVLSCSVAHP